MNLKQLSAIRRDWLDRHFPYDMVYWEEFDFTILSNITYRKRSGCKNNHSVNDAIIMADTETSKKRKYTVIDKHNKVMENHVVAWTISIRCFERNLVTLYGRKPSDMCHVFRLMMEHMGGEETIIYFHNASYDYQFLRLFLYKEFGLPENQLNTKSHYPILIRWACGLTIKDSLILFQRSIEKTAKDFNVEHQKAVGFWEYDKIRTQHEIFTKEELKYIECDTLAGVECLDALRIQLHKQIYSMPYTATGIPREDVRKIGAENFARNDFKRMVSPDYYIQAMLQKVYHGGFTHANRHLVDRILTGLISCRDFASSYPFSMLTAGMPIEKFFRLDDKPKDYIIRNAESYAFMFKFIAVNVRLKDDMLPMPCLQFSKATKIINAVTDNGRVLKCAYIEIYLTERDLQIIDELYTFDKHICTEVHASRKGYLPRWFTDYVYKCFEEKTQSKGGDPVEYALKKARLNSLYGLTVQSPIKQKINEEYETGEFIEEHKDPAELYDIYYKRYTSILPYQWGCWVTADAMYRLFQLAKCIDYEHGGQWVYSDTDSIYSNLWDEKKLEAYNERQKEALRKNGYGPVIFKGREYWLGVAEQDDETDYTAFITQGCKRYAGRCKADGKVHITVAGVPKKTGASCLDDDLNNFRKGFIFPGTSTGKLMHSYYYSEKGIYVDEDGNETGDSINLEPCDYMLDITQVTDWDDIDTEEITLQIYDEEDNIGRI